jgi:hypothetical protein
MAVLKTTSPAICPSIPIATPRKILPSARANRAAFLKETSTSYVKNRRRKREGPRGTFPFLNYCPFLNYWIKQTIK